MKPPRPRTHHHRSAAPLWLLAVVAIAALCWLGVRFLVTSGTLQTYVIQSGSMSPSIMTGDLIIISPQAEYTVADVISFRAADGRVVTHRIKRLENEQYLTKGDANEHDDPELVPAPAVLGKVQLVLPRLGHAVAFTRKPAIFFSIIGLSLGILLLDVVLQPNTKKPRGLRRILSS